MPTSSIVTDSACETARIEVRVVIGGSSVNGVFHGASRQHWQRKRTASSSAVAMKAQQGSAPNAGKQCHAVSEKFTSADAIWLLRRGNPLICPRAKGLARFLRAHSLWTHVWWHSRVKGRTAMTRCTRDRRHNYTRPGG